MRRDDWFGLYILLAFGVIGCILSLWVSNTSFCLNYKKDITDYIQRFNYCATRIDYTK